MYQGPMQTFSNGLETRLPYRLVKTIGTQICCVHQHTSVEAENLGGAGGLVKGELSPPQNLKLIK